MSRQRIAIAGFQHETNTFAPMLTTYDEFDTGGSWPAMTQGQDIIKVFSDLNIPIGGFIQAANDWELLPILWAAAEPGGYVATSGFDSVMTIICDGIKAAGSIDGVYLDLHGAMVVDDYEDGEGEIVRRVRKLVGNSIPIAVSLDLHGNVFPKFFELCDVVTIYRTYPHIDMAETGRRACRLLRQRIDGGVPLAKAYRQLDYLISLQSQSTMHEPAKKLYESLGAIEDTAVLSADIALGFPPADITHCGASMVCYGTDQAACDRYAKQLHDEMDRLESEFVDPMMSAADAVAQAMLLSQTASAPVVICDPQDNPGAGASGDTTGLLRALINGGAQDAWLGLLWDPDAAAIAHEKGVGTQCEVTLGGRYADSAPENAPLTVQVVVEQIGDGNFVFTGPMYGGATAALGKMALLKIVRDDCDVHVIVSSIRTQNADCEIFRTMGVEPEKKKLLVVKSAIHFMADYQPIACEILFAEADGLNPCALDRVKYKNLRHGVRLGPNGPVWTG